MANYDNTICYIFEKKDVVRKLFSEIIEDKGTEKLLDMSKIKPVPENLSEEDGMKWAIENWGSSYYTMFEYTIYEKFSKIELEGQYSVFPELFINLAKKFSVPVLIVYYTEDESGNGMRFVDFKKEIQVGYDVPDFGRMNVFSNLNAINFHALGIEQNIYECFQDNLVPIENDGCMMTRQHKERKKKEEIEEELKAQTIQNQSKDGDW